LSDTKKKQTIELTLPLIFDAIDSNKDHEIGLEEFTAYFQSLGINDSKGKSFIFFFIFLFRVQNKQLIKKRLVIYFQPWTRTTMELLHWTNLLYLV